MNKNMILKRLQIIDDLLNELAVVRDMYESALENDPAYQEVQEVETKAKAEITQKKSVVLGNSEYIKLAEQLKEKRVQIKEAKEALSQDLADYYRESGELEIEDQNGNIKRIKFSVKLVS